MNFHFWTFYALSSYIVFHIMVFAEWTLYRVICHKIEEKVERNISVFENIKTRFSNVLVFLENEQLRNGNMPCRYNLCKTAGQPRLLY
jgi:hypothetical protein